MTAGSSSGPSGGAWDDSDPNNGGGFITVRRGDAGGRRLRDEYEERLRARLGDAAYERWKRSRALSLNPQPLSARQAAILWDAIAPLVRDMEATGQALPDIQAEAHHYLGAGIVCAWIRGPGATGQGISVLPPGQHGNQLYDLAEQLQCWANDLQGDPQRRQWPDCPAHPGAHRLEPEATGDTAVWYCPQTARAVAEIGTLGSGPLAGIPRIKSRKPGDSTRRRL